MAAKRVAVGIPTNDLERACRFYLKGLGLNLAVDLPAGSRPEPVVFQLLTGWEAERNDLGASIVAFAGRGPGEWPKRVIHFLPDPGGSYSSPAMALQPLCR